MSRPKENKNSQSILLKNMTMITIPLYFFFTLWLREWEKSVREVERGGLILSGQRLMGTRRKDH